VVKEEGEEEEVDSSCTPATGSRCNVPGWQGSLANRTGPRIAREYQDQGLGGSWLAGDRQFIGIYSGILISPSLVRPGTHG
jgi:hypothetical protein